MATRWSSTSLLGILAALCSMAILSAGMPTGFPPQQTMPTDMTPTGQSTGGSFTNGMPTGFPPQQTMPPELTPPGQSTGGSFTNAMPSGGPPPTDSPDDQGTGGTTAPMQGTGGGPILSLFFIQTAPPRVELLRGNQVTLPCDVGGFVNPPTIIWRRNNVKVDLSVDNAYMQLVNGTLQLLARTETLSGNFDCLVMSNDGPAVADLASPVTVVVIAAIDNSFVTSPAGKIVPYGTVVYLNCTIRSTPAATITWRRNDRTLTTDGLGNLTIQNVGATSYLKIPAAQFTDDGSRWQCLAVNPQYQRFTVLSQIATITVQGRPVFSARPVPPANIHVGDSFTLPCQAVARPPATISWTGPPLNTPITANSTHLSITSAGLVVTNVVMSDQGQWSCIAMNTYGTVTVHFQMTVQAASNSPTFTTRPGSQSVGVGVNVILRCQASGVPAPLISWQKDSSDLNLTSSGLQWIPGTGTLTLTRVSLSSSGSYTCIASNTQGRDTASAVISVVAFPVITPALQNRTVTAGSSLTLTCFSTPSSGVTTVWRHNNRVVGTSSSLTGPSISLAEAGQYWCEKTNAAGTARASLYVTVQGLPTFTTSPSDVTILLGSSASLKCRVSGVPPPTISWQRGSTTVQNSLHVSVASDNSLDIVNADAASSGAYTCVGTNAAGTVRSSANVNVISRIAFTSFPQDTTAVAGRTASMVCAAAAGSARVSYTWYYPNNSRIDPSVDSRLMISAGTLNFLSVDFSQRGTYSCRVQVIGSTFLKDASALLTVWVPPSITTPPTVTNVTKGNTAMLTCVVSGIPAPMISWRRKGALLASPTVMATNSNIRLDAVGTLFIGDATKANDDADYTCVANSSAGVATATARLHVREPPIISTANITVTSPGQAQLLCTIAAGDPQPVITWSYDNGTALPTGPKHRVSSDSLTITNTLVSDEGFYRCTATNSLATISVRAFLEVQVVPTARIQTALPGRVDAHINSNVTLRCLVTGKPAPTVQWGLNNIGVSNSSRTVILGPQRDTILLLGVSSQQSGTWVCRADNGPSRFAVSQGILFVLQVPPPAATSLQEVSKTSNSIEIRWSVSGTGNSPITNITIDFAVGPSTNFTRYLATSNPNLRELNVSNLQPFTSYRFRVTLVNAVGASAPSVTGALQTCSAVSSAVIDINVITLNSTSLNVTWSAPEFPNGRITAYRVARSTANAPQTGPLLSETVSEFLVITDLDVYTGYGFTVTPFTEDSCNGGDVAGPVSSPAMGTTGELPPLEAPRNVTTTSVNDGTLMVAWLSPRVSLLRGKLVSFRLYFRRTTEAALADYETVPIAIDEPAEDERYSHHLRNIAAGTAYDIKVQAYNSAGGGPNSTVVPAETQAVESSSTTSAGKLAGIIVGAVCGVLIIIAFFLFCKNHRQSAAKAKKESMYDVEDSWQGEIESSKVSSSKSKQQRKQGRSQRYDDDEEEVQQTKSKHSKRKDNDYSGNIPKAPPPPPAYVNTATGGRDTAEHSRQSADITENMPEWLQQEVKSKRESERRAVSESPRVVRPAKGTRVAMIEKTDTFDQGPAAQVNLNDYGDGNDDDEAGNEGETHFGTDYTEDDTAQDDSGANDLYSMPNMSRKSVKKHKDDDYYDENDDANEGPALQGHGNDQTQLIAGNTPRSSSMYEDPGESAPKSAPFSARAAEEESKRKAQLAAAKKREENDRREWQKQRAKEEAEAEKLRKRALKEEQKRAEKAAKDARKLREKEEKERKKSGSKSSAPSSYDWDDDDDFASGTPGKAMKSKKGKKKKNSGSSDYGGGSSSMMMY